MDPIQCKTTSCRAGLDDRVNRIFFFFLFLSRSFEKRCTCIGEG